MLQSMIVIKMDGHVSDKRSDYMEKYTLDRFDEDFAVLLKYPTEDEQLLIPKEKPSRVR